MTCLWVLLGDRVSSIESISSSNDKTTGSSTHSPLRSRQGPVTLTSWAQSPTVDEVIRAVTVDVLVMVDRVTNGCFFFKKACSGYLLKSRSSSSVPLRKSASASSTELDPPSSFSSNITNMSSDDSTDRCCIPIPALALALPQAHKDGPIDIVVRITIDKMMDFISIIRTVFS